MAIPSVPSGVPSYGRYILGVLGMFLEAYTLAGASVLAEHEDVPRVSGDYRLWTVEHLEVAASSTPHGSTLVAELPSTVSLVRATCAGWFQGT